MSEIESNVSKKLCVTSKLSDSLDSILTDMALVAGSCAALIPNPQGSMTGSQCEFLKLKLDAAKVKNISAES